MFTVDIINMIYEYAAIDKNMLHGELLYFFHKGQIFEILNREAVIAAMTDSQDEEYVEDYDVETVIGVLNWYNLKLGNSKWKILSFCGKYINEPYDYYMYSNLIIPSLNMHAICTSIYEQEYFRTKYETQDFKDHKEKSEEIGYEFAYKLYKKNSTCFDYFNNLRAVCEEIKNRPVQL